MKTSIKICLLVLCGIINSRAAFAQEVKTFIEPYRDIELSATEMGVIAYINVKEGEMVSSGKVLAGLNESVAAASLRTAKRAKDARGRLRSAEVELKRAEFRFNKLEELHSRRHATEQEIDRAETELQIAKAKVESVRDELAVKNADYERIAAQLELKRIKSPIDGVVAEVFKDVGEFVSANDSVVIRVVQLNPVIAVFSLPADQARALKQNENVPVRVGASKTSVMAKVEFISPTVDAQTGTVRVKVVISNSLEKWQAGDRCWIAGQSLSNRKLSRQAFSSRTKLANKAPASQNP